MNEKIDVNLLDLKLCIMASVDSLYGLRRVPFRTQFADILRNEARKGIQKGESSGSFTISNTDLSLIVIEMPRSVHVKWQTFPLWWSDHPRWWEAPFCGQIVLLPKEGKVDAKNPHFSDNFPIGSLGTPNSHR